MVYFKRAEFWHRTGAKSTLSLPRFQPYYIRVEITEDVDDGRVDR